ncbi:MAG: ABC transporter permease [Bacteroidota bacterium]
MLKNHTKIALRSLLKNKTFTLLNLIGLSVAFATAILLTMAGFFELSFDRFHENRDDLFKVYSVWQNPKGQQVSESHAAPLMPTIKNEVPGIDKATRLLEEEVIVSYGEKEINMDVNWVDAEFFAMFSFPVLQGKVDNPLENRSDIVLTAEMANVLFGEDDAVGKTVNILIDGKDKPFTVSAVVANIRDNSTIEFDVAMRFEEEASYQTSKDTWNNRYHDVYVQLAQHTSPAQFDGATRSLISKNFAERIANAKRDGATPDKDGRYYRFQLVSLNEVNFVSFEKGVLDISRSGPYLVLGIALLILFIAFVNFVNMSVARSGQRLKEIGMRKALGAKQKQLFFQFWIESLFLFLFATGIGLLLSALLLQEFKTLFDTDVSFNLIINPLTLFCFFGVILLITFIVGGYPAVLLSRLGTLNSLKGKLEQSGKNRVRDVLMIVQFGVATILIIGTLVLQSQLRFMRNKDLGFNKEQVISFPIDGKKDSYEALDLLRNELSGNPDILQITGADNNLGVGKDGSISRSMFGFEYKNRVINTNVLTVDDDFVETLDIPVLKGKSFSREFSKQERGVVINEAMAREFAEVDPLTAYVKINDSLKLPVLGVVKDYHFERLDMAIQPMTIFKSRDWDLYYAYVKVASANLGRSMEAVEKAWAKIEPNAEFLGSFLDENIDRTYRREKRITTMVTTGSLIAITLSCIGLFAISFLIISQRTKEIGVRKVIGASVGNIALLLIRDYLKLVVISFVIAAPIAWWAMHRWLQNYPFKIELSIWFFMAGGTIALVIALLTVSSKTIMAALQTPVKSLRTE